MAAASAAPGINGDGLNLAMLMAFRHGDGNDLRGSVPLQQKRTARIARDDGAAQAKDGWVDLEEATVIVAHQTFGRVAAIGKQGEGRANLDRSGGKRQGRCNLGRYRLVEDQKGDVAFEARNAGRQEFNAMSGGDGSPGVPSGGEIHGTRVDLLVREQAEAMRGGEHEVGGD